MSGPHLNNSTDIDVQAELHMKEDIQLGPVTAITKRKRSHSQIPVDRTNSGNLDRSARKSCGQRTKRTKHSTPLQLHTPDSLVPEISPPALSPPCSILYSPVGSEPTNVPTPNIHNIYESASQQNHSYPPHADESSTPRNTEDSILKLLSGSKIGSTRDTAAFYLSSFLAHIETLGKLPSSQFHATLFQNCWS